MWISPNEEAGRNLVVFFNGENVTGNCVGFERLFSSGISYWGTLSLITKLFLPAALSAIGGEAGAIGAITTMRGIIVWSEVDLGDITQLLDGRHDPDEEE